MWLQLLYLFHKKRKKRQLVQININWPNIIILFFTAQNVIIVLRYCIMQLTKFKFVSCGHDIVITLKLLQKLELMHKITLRLC